MHKHSSDASSPNTSPVVVKNEVDIINYAENNQMDPTEVYYGRSSYRGGSRFNSWRGKINRGGRRQGNWNKAASFTGLMTVLTLTVAGMNMAVKTKRSFHGTHCSY